MEVPKRGNQSIYGRSLDMKKHLSIIFLAGLLLIYGAVGGLETNRIGFLQTAIICLCGLGCLAYVGYWGENGGYK